MTRPFSPLLLAGALAAGLALAPAAGGDRAEAATGASTILVRPGGVISGVALAGGLLTWHEESTTGERAPALLERPVSGGRVRTLTRDAEPSMGLAASPRFVIYGRRRAESLQLVAQPRDGSKPILLSRSLVAPLTARGPRIAWAERAGAGQRVVVGRYGSASGWVASRMRYCRDPGCFRIDTVTLADGGVVIARGAIGSQPSQVVMRPYGDRARTVSLANDSQPDLVPASDGAFFYRLERGWFSWPLGAAAPTSAGLNVTDPPRVLASERGRLLILEGRSCEQRLVVRAADGTRGTLAPPAVPRSVPRGYGRICRQLSAYSWSGGRLLSAWSFLPETSVEGHSDFGLVSAIVRQPT